MVYRCRICGTPVNYVKICNYCSTVKEERRFIKMVNREELKATRAIGDDKGSPADPRTFLK